MSGSLLFNKWTLDFSGVLWQELIVSCLIAYSHKDLDLDLVIVFYMYIVCACYIWGCRPVVKGPDPFSHSLSCGARWERVRGKTCLPVVL